MARQCSRSGKTIYSLNEAEKTDNAFIGNKNTYESYSTTEEDYYKESAGASGYKEESKTIGQQLGSIVTVIINFADEISTLEHLEFALNAFDIYYLNISVLAGHFLEENLTKLLKYSNFASFEIRKHQKLIDNHW